MKWLFALLLLASPALAQVALQPKWDMEFRGSWNAADFARVKKFQDAPYTDRNLHPHPDSSRDKCESSGQPEDCHGLVCGPYGCVVPSE